MGKGEEAVEDLYEIMEELDPNEESRLYTLLDGENAGEKLLLCGGSVRYASQENGFLAAHLKELKGTDSSGFSIFEAAGRRVFAETLGRTSRMIICGGGHVAIPVIRMAKLLGFQVTVLEDREEFAEHAKNAGADTVFSDGYEDHLREIPGSPDTYYIILTRGHLFDRQCLEACIRKPSAYVGMIGSRRKVALVREVMLSEGYTEEELNRVHAPIGLEIGAETPAEIAVSILAQVIETKNKLRKNAVFPGDVLNAILEKPGHGSCVLAEIIRKTGSAPRGPGSRIAVFGDGTTVGTVGGGSEEASVVQRCRELMKAESSRHFETIHVEMEQNTAAEEGLICGGTIEVMLERIR